MSEASAATAAGLKPLKVSQRPSDSSQKKISGSAINDSVETCWFRPRTERPAEARNTGAPMRPIAGMRRGTSRDRYST